MLVYFRHSLVSNYTLLNLVSPECHFSRDALTLFDKLGEIYKDDSDFVLGKLDATVDELPRLPIKGTPMFYLYLKDTNEVGFVIVLCNYL